MKKILIFLATIVLAIGTSNAIEVDDAKEPPAATKEFIFPALHNEEYEFKEEKFERLVKEWETKPKYKKRDVIFTNFYTNDSTGSTNITYSGLTTDKFGANSDGFHTYEGKVVLATANVGISNRFVLKSGYRYHNLYDEIEFTLNGKHYTGIVLDACGACFGVPHENVQRYDIFTTGPNFGHTYGTIRELTE